MIGSKDPNPNPLLSSILILSIQNRSSDSRDQKDRIEVWIDPRLVVFLVESQQQLDRFDEIFDQHRHDWEEEEEETLIVRWKGRESFNWEEKGKGGKGWERETGGLVLLFYSLLWGKRRERDCFEYFTNGALNLRVQFCSELKRDENENLTVDSDLCLGQPRIRTQPRYYGPK